ncbi:segregation and condensation protein A [Paenibacillus radicis (ex Gao et al. 2016)]|uniref:Segregation and condensation protein A n=1 Tax=Paenibacillus radicis (ex Gao et al. 2016) TaxID=1737354 RepID=A0A917GVA5_9BACL|nr:segregation/condensation protein A [Paenibacillus radicis (ex Gao et al. 2016)]GGG57275.1 segregation and condensation protein A [Paenibacillus radicis (ex Gao et al. 2016)]
MTVLYKLESFEGPLDLLLHLIDKAEIDIHEVSISEITDQYMEYLHAMKELELDVTSEFLVMAATLLSIKSKQLLPKPPVFEDEYEDWQDDGLDPRDELIQKLVEYRKFKQIAEQLREKELERSLVYSREPDDMTPYLKKEDVNPLEGLHVSDIVAAFQRAIRRAARRNIVATVQRDEISVKDRIRDIVEVLRQFETVRFSKLIRENMDKHEVVVTFLAILELMKMKHIRCFQHTLFEDIVIHWRGEAADSGLSEVEVDY